MVFCGSINLCADQSQRILAACSNVISTAADLENAVLACIYGAKMKVCAFDCFACLNFADNDFGYVLAYFVLFFYFEAAAEELVLELIRCDINIYVIFKPT